MFVYLAKQGVRFFSSIAAKKESILLSDGALGMVGAALHLPGAPCNGAWAGPLRAQRRREGYGGRRRGSWSPRPPEAFHLFPRLVLLPKVSSARERSVDILSAHDTGMPWRLALNSQEPREKRGAVTP